MPEVARAPRTRTKRTKRTRPELSLVPARTNEPKVAPATDEAARRFAVCRTLGHTWQHVGAADPTERKPLGQYNSIAYVSRCSHCGTTRTKWMSRYGNRGAVVYRYPEQYERRGEERLSLQAWRRTWIVGTFGDQA